MTTQDTSVGDTAALDYDEADEAWFEEPDELPPRRRRKLVGPVPAVLLAILLLAGGFLAGVLVEKGETSSSSSAAGGSAAGLAARFKALRSAAGGTGTGTGAAASGEAGAARSPFGGGATTGQVAFVEGSTIYVTNAEGNTVKVKTSSGSQVTKTVKTDVKGIHPGETVLITGPTAKDGTVTAESIRVGSTGGGLGALFGGGAGAGSGGGGGSGSGGSTSKGGSEPSLFGSG